VPLFQARDFPLAGGAVLAELAVAYECYGELAPDRGNAILVTHGITSSHHAAGAIAADRRTGWWSEAIGPGKVFDTERYCVVSSNMLGSCYGSTGPASIDPATGRPYGRHFPAISFEDIVKAQHLLLRALGIERLVAVAGQSLGGFQAFQWAVTFPDFMAGIVAMDTAPRDLFDSASAADGLVAELAKGANWNGGDYYGGAGMEKALTAIRIAILKSYGFEERLAGTAAEREAVLAETARDWAREFDANSLIALRRAMARYNVEDEFHRIRARLIYVLCDTDEWFPARIGKDVMAKLAKAGVEATFLEVKSRHGHYATSEEPEKWVLAVRQFLERLDTGRRS
jgi:homoserine O-acetyltransferase